MARDIQKTPNQHKKILPRGKLACDIFDESAAPKAWR